MKILTLENKDKKKLPSLPKQESYVSTIKDIFPEESECITDELIRFISSDLALYTFC